MTKVCQSCGITYVPDFYLEDDDLFIEIKGYEYGRCLEKVKEARSLGNTVLYLNGDTLKKIYGLDLSQKRLNQVATKVA